MTAWPVELLAPARDLDCGRAAIDHGADAVYIGAPRFGARAAAGNSLADIEALVAYAHRFWARVYVAMNTLLTDDELTEATRLARHLAVAGVDGLIVQDVGLLETELPRGLRLIASTQMHNREPDRVRFWGEVGFSRVILARELSLAAIRQIRDAAPDIELECFVHGALCVSYSGQCYLSHALGGRSGNRGQCAQPCRKPYSLVDAAGRVLVAERHLLSLRDLDLTQHLASLLDAGVTSFKIEGRLKDRAYVATTVAHYRAALDALLAARGLRRASSGTSSGAFEPDVTRVFSRGQTSYFLAQRPETMATLGTPKSLGPHVGRVARVRGQVLELTLAADRPELHAGDGLVYFDAAGRLRGTTVNRARGSRLEVETPEGIVPGVELHRNHDHEYLATAGASAPRRVVGVVLTLRHAPQRLELELEDEDGVGATACVEGDWEAAQDQARARALLEQQLTKLGDTELVCRELRVLAPALSHVPRATLNALRRAAVASLRAARSAARPVWRPPPRAAAPAPPRFPQPTVDYLANVLNDKAFEFYRRHGVEVSERAPEAGTSLRARAVMTTKYCVRHELGWCVRDGKDPPGVPPYSLVDSAGVRLRLEFDCAACEMQVLFEGDEPAAEVGAQAHPPRGR